MPVTTAGLPNLKGKVHPDVEDALVRIFNQNESVKGMLAAFQAQIQDLPTQAQLQQHAARIENAVSTLPSYDTLAAGVSSPLIQQASVLPTVVGAFAYTSTGSTITWYWDGTNGSTLLSILFPNGVVIPVPPASFTVTGLAASTTYKFYPYFDVNFYANLFAQDPTNGTGTPPAAFGPAANTNNVKQIVSADNHVSMTDTTMTGATTAGGAGGGSGGGSGGRCVSEDAKIVPLAGEVFSYLSPEHEWLELQTISELTLRANKDHRIFTDSGCVRMRDLQRNMRVITVNGLSTVRDVREIEEAGKKRLVWVPQGNLYWANGILCHNKA